MLLNVPPEKWRKASDFNFPGGRPASGITRLYNPPEEVEYLAKLTANEFFKEYSRAKGKKSLPNVFFTPGRGGYLWAEFGFKEFVRIARWNRLQVPTMIPFISTLYESEGNAGEYEERGLIHGLEQWTSSHPREELRGAYLEDIIDTLRTMGETTKQIAKTLSMNKVKFSEFWTVSPYGKTTHYEDNLKLANNELSGYDTKLSIFHHFNTSDWMVQLHETDGYQEQPSDLYSVLTHQKGNVRDILLENELNAHFYYPDTVRGKTEAGMALARKFVEKEQALPSLVLSFSPYLKSSYSLSDTITGISAHDSLSAWDNVSQTREDMGVNSLKIQGSAQKNKRKILYDNLFGHDTYFNMIGDGFFKKQPYSAIVGDNPVLLVTSHVPDMLTKERVSEILNIDKRQIFFAAAYQNKKNPVDIHL